MFNLFHRNFADAREALKLVQEGNAILFDVRTPAEFAGQHAVGAKNLPLEQLARGINPQLNINTPIFVNVGGLNNWIAAGGILE